MLDEEGKEILEEVMSDVDDDTPIRPGGARKRRSFVLGGRSESDGDTGGNTAAARRKKQKQTSHKSVGDLQYVTKKLYLPFLQANATKKARQKSQKKRQGDQLEVDSEGEISTEESSDGQTAINEVRIHAKAAPARRGPKSDTRLHWLDPVAIIEPGQVPNRWQFKCKYCDM